MDWSDPKAVAEAAFRIYPYAAEIVRNGAIDDKEFAQLGARVDAVRQGLQPEAEFVAIANWLGNCLAVHRLDQAQMPVYHAHDEIRVPDVLAIVSLGESVLPVLIEIKRTDKQTLKWSEGYLNSLRRYATALGFPLLIAWKWQNSWFLVEEAHFQKAVTAYHLPLEKALEENLMDEILGDRRVQLHSRVAFFLDADVTDVIPPMPSLIPEGVHTFKLKGAGFLLDGKPILLSNELATLFFCAPQENPLERTAEQGVRVFHTAVADQTFPLSHLLLAQLLLGGSDPDAIEWEGLLSRRVAISAKDAAAALPGGIDIGLVRYVLHQVPQTKPAFL